MSVSRGEIWWAAIPDLGNRPVLPTSELRDQLGMLSPDRMLEVEDALRQALDL